ncbi:MAG: transketolase C-terminal domain-containing protein [Candidatus Magasanikbacteria bacterium]
MYFLTGDLGYSVLEDFQSELPDQVINAGIAEQNMMSVAAGLALAGKKVFVYSIIPFVTMRCFEQVRVDVCYQNLDVTIIGVGGGFAYGTLGTTHYGLEDLAIMRSLPNMKVVAMSDPLEAGQLFEQILNTKGPWYIRLNRGGEKALVEQISPPQIGIGSVLKNGSQVTIFSIGAITDVALSASANLEKSGIQAEVIHMHTLKPLDKEIIMDRARTRVAIITLEEHSIIGGLGSAVAEVLADNGLAVPFRRLGLHDKYLSVIGRQDFLRTQAGLSEEVVVDVIKELCK